VLQKKLFVNYSTLSAEF